MTDIAKLRDDVIKAAKAWGAAPKRAENNSALSEQMALYRAVQVLQAVEEASKKPRLRTALTFACDMNGDMVAAAPFVTQQIIRARDAEWMAAIRPLAREIFDGSQIVRLADIEALAESAK